MAPGQILIRRLSHVYELFFLKGEIFFRFLSFFILCGRCDLVGESRIAEPDMAIGQGPPFTLGGRLILNQPANHLVPSSSTRPI